MIDIKKLNEMVAHLNEILPKKDHYEESDLIACAQLIGLLSLISTESVYLIGDLTKLMNTRPELAQSLKNFDKNAN